MACNACETAFNSSSVLVSVQAAGATANLYVQNQGRNIVMIRRILLCYATAGSTGILFLRPPPDQITWTYPSAFLETGISALYYQLNAANVQIVQAQAEYIEIDGRSRSCSTTF